MTSTRAVLGIAAGILAILVLSVVVVLVAGGRGSQQFPAGSPESALQAYLAAHEDGDYEVAYGHFSADVRDQVSQAEYRQTSRDLHGFQPPELRRAVYIGEVEPDGERASVHLTVEEWYGDPFGGTSRSEREVRMVREDGDWKIDEPLIGLEPAPFGEFQGL